MTERDPGPYRVDGAREYIVHINARGEVLEGIRPDMSATALCAQLNYTFKLGAQQAEAEIAQLSNDLRAEQQWSRDNRAEAERLKQELARARVNALNDASELAILKADLREARQQLQDLLTCTPGAP